MLQIVFIERNVLTQTVEKYFCERLLSQDASGEWSMRHLLNTLFVLSEDIYLSLENENIIAWKEKKVAQKIPLLNLENILYFGYKGASPTLLGECAK